jgi:hypothetical protein
VEWFGLAALGQAVARLSSDILPSLSTAGSTADNITKLTDMLQQWSRGEHRSIIAVPDDASYGARCRHSSTAAPTYVMQGTAPNGDIW